MRPRELLCSSAFMMLAALVIALLTNFTGTFPDEILTADARSNLTVLTLAVMMTVSLSRIPYRNLNPIKNWRSVMRAVMLGIVIPSLIPLTAYFALSNTAYGEYATGLIFLAATPFAASVVPLSYVLRGDMEHAARGTITVYLLSLLWIPSIIYLTLGEYVEMQTVALTVVEIIGLPLLLSRLLTRLRIEREMMSAFMNCCIFFLVWLSVSSTSFPTELFPLFAFLIIAILRTFLLGNIVEVVEKRAGIGWSQRVTDILMTSYKNKGIAIALCVAVMGPLVPISIVPIALSIVVEICWVAFMDSVLFSKTRMKREMSKDAAMSL